MALKNFIQTVGEVEPWISPDLKTGSQWHPEILRRLIRTDVGIVCVTPYNFHASWLTFEAGIMIGTDRISVLPLLFGVEPSQLGGPLQQLQSLQGDRDGIYQLILNLNERFKLGRDQLNTRFKSSWPKFEEDLERAQETALGLPQEKKIWNLLNDAIAAVQLTRLQPSEESFWMALRAMEAVIHENVSELRDGLEDDIHTLEKELSIFDREGVTKPLKSRIEKLKKAELLLRSNIPSTLSATSVVIYRFEDLLEAAKRLESDLY
jgi:hypothetical protein